MNVEEVKDKILSAMNDASSIEELLKLKLEFSKIFYTKYYNFKLSTFYKNVERIVFNNAILNRDNIVEELNNGISEVEIADKYNITLLALRNLFGDNKQESVTLNYDLDFICAKVAVRLFLDNEVYNANDALERKYVNKKDYSKYIEILKNRNHPLYYEYITKAKEHKNSLYIKKNSSKEKIIKDANNIDNLSNKELFSILNNPFSFKINFFTEYYGLNNIIFTSMLKLNKNLACEIVSNRDNAIFIYDYYLNLYKQVSLQVIKDIILLSKDDFKKPLDIYKYYANNYNLIYIAKIAKELPDLKNNTLILRYTEKFSSLFEFLDERKINNIKLKGQLFCLSENISFTKTDFVKALEDIDEKGMPLLKGVLYGSIKRQIELKDVNVKKKVL